MSISAMSGQVVGQRGEQRGQVGDRAGDLEAVGGQQLGEAVSDERGVVGDQDSHGISALTVVPWPGGLWTVRRPLRAPTRSARPPQAAAGLEVGAAATVVADHHDEAAVHRGCMETFGGVCVCVFGDVGQGFGDDEVGGALDGFGVASIGDIEGDRHRRPVGEAAHRRGQAVRGQDRGMDTAASSRNSRSPGLQLGAPRRASRCCRRLSAQQLEGQPGG